METLDEIIDAAIKASGANSQADFARKIGVSHPTITNWKTRRSTPDAYALMELQKILKKDARELLAIIEAERAKDSNRREYWNEVKKSFRTTSAAALVGLALFLSIGQPNSAEAKEFTIKHDNSYVYYVKLETHNELLETHTPQ